MGWQVSLWRMGVVWTCVLLFSYIKLVFKLFFFRAEIHPRCSPASHSARACIVTGASSGIGKATAETLALEGYYVILAGRSLPNLMKAVKELKEKHGENISLHAMELDLCSVRSIVSFVDGVKAWLASQTTTPVALQLLVNNAGILAASRRYTADGYDTMVMTNYLGPYILTRLLLPLLLKCSQPARIVNVASFTHRSARNLDITALFAKKKYDSEKLYKMAKIYEASKLSVLYLTYELHRRYSSDSRISIMAADPGIVHTRILRELPWWLVQLTLMILRGAFLLQTTDCGARAVVDAALAPIEVSGKYFFGGNGFTLPSSKLSYDEKISKELWDSSNKAYRQALES